MSGSKPERIISWDSCVFLAWFLQEPKKPLEDISSWLSDISKNKVGLIISAVVCAEVLDKAGENTAGQDFRKYAKRYGIVRANVDWKIAEMAVQYRQRACIALSKHEVSKGIKAPDALIAATAVHFKAEVLHSFDPVLLEMSGTEIIDGLIVEEPMYPANQPLFDWLHKPKQTSQP